MSNNKAETNKYTQTDQIQNPSSGNLKCFTRDFFTRDFCSKNVLPGKNPGKLEKFTREKKTTDLSHLIRYSLDSMFVVFTFRFEIHLIR